MTTNQSLYADPLGWGPPNMSKIVGDVAVDGNGRVFVLVPGTRLGDMTVLERDVITENRKARIADFARRSGVTSDCRIEVYAADGTLLKSWMTLQGSHGITVSPDGTVWIANFHDHAVRQFSEDGVLLLVLGDPGVHSDTGTTAYGGIVEQAAAPFNRPTRVAFSQGDIYVADGYSNARIHRFNSGGELLQSWGEPGSGPGQFRLVHDLAFDSKGNLFVSDRKNNRVQVFDANGDFLREVVSRNPAAIAIDPEDRLIVAECDVVTRALAGLGYVSRDGSTEDFNGGRLKVYDTDGHLIHETTPGTQPCQPGTVSWPHGVAAGPDGNVYVASIAIVSYIGIDAISAGFRDQADRILADCVGVTLMPCVG